MLNARFFTLARIVFSAAAMRLIPHPPNFTPIAAMAPFGGFALMQRRYPALREEPALAMARP